MWVIFYKKYEECESATTLSMFGAGGILIGIIFSPLLYLAASDIGWMRIETLVFALLVLFFLGGGIFSMWYAPRHYRKVLVKRIMNDYEYGRYLADKYPQYEWLVKEINPLYNEDDPRPIVDYLVKTKEAKQLPMWERIVLGIIGCILLVILYIAMSETS